MIAGDIEGGVVDLLFVADFEILRMLNRGVAIQQREPRQDRERGQIAGKRRVVAREVRCDCPR